jgi:hypothetical protein
VISLHDQPSPVSSQTSFLPSDIHASSSHKTKRIGSIFRHSSTIPVAIRSIVGRNLGTNPLAFGPRDGT